MKTPPTAPLRVGVFELGIHPAMELRALHPVGICNPFRAGVAIGQGVAILPSSRNPRDIVPGGRNAWETSQSYGACPHRAPRAQGSVQMTKDLHGHRLSGASQAARDHYERALGLFRLYSGDPLAAAEAAIDES